jgi:hypothetical protein
MDYEQIKTIVEEVINNATIVDWWIYVLIIAFSAIGGFIGAYLKKKGENLATKEDIEIITEKIEKIRSQYSEQLETVKASLQLSNQLKLAALDKRLQKHQEAYTLWVEIVWNLSNDDEIGRIVIKCQEWWNENCLYLGEDSRGAFKKALLLAPVFYQLTNTKDRQKYFDSIMDAGEIIIKDVKLPSLGYDEIIARD